MSISFRPEYTIWHKTGANILELGLCVMLTCLRTNINHQHLSANVYSGYYNSTYTALTSLAKVNIFDQEVCSACKRIIMRMKAGSSKMQYLTVFWTVWSKSKLYLLGKHFK